MYLHVRIPIGKNFGLSVSGCLAKADLSAKVCLVLERANNREQFVTSKPCARREEHVSGASCCSSGPPKDPGRQ